MEYSDLVLAVRVKKKKKTGRDQATESINQLIQLFNSMFFSIPLYNNKEDGLKESFENTEKDNSENKNNETLISSEVRLALRIIGGRVPDARTITPLNIDLYGPIGGGELSLFTQTLFFNGEKVPEGPLWDVGFGAGYDAGISFVVTDYYYINGEGNLKLSDFNGQRLSASLGLSYKCVEHGNGLVYSKVKRGGFIIGITQYIGISPSGVSFNFNKGWSNFED